MGGLRRWGTSLVAVGMLASGVVAGDAPYLAVRRSTDSFLVGVLDGRSLDHEAIAQPCGTLERAIPGFTAQGETSVLQCFQSMSDGTRFYTGVPVEGGDEGRTGGMLRGYVYLLTPPPVLLIQDDQGRDLRLCDYLSGLVGEDVTSFPECDPSRRGLCDAPVLRLRAVVRKGGWGAPRTPEDVEHFWGPDHLGEDGAITPEAWEEFKDDLRVVEVQNSPCLRTVLGFASHMADLGEGGDDANTFHRWIYRGRPVFAKRPPEPMFEGDLVMDFDFVALSPECFTQEQLEYLSRGTVQRVRDSVGGLFGRGP